MPVTIRDQILSAPDTRLEPVEVPEWGCTVFVPVLTIADQAEMARLAKTSKSADPNVTAAIFVIRDADGRRVFSDEDAAAVAVKSLAVFNRVVAKFNEINGLAGDDPRKN